MSNLLKLSPPAMATLVYGAVVMLVGLIASLDAEFVSESNREQAELSLRYAPLFAGGASLLAAVARRFWLGWRRGKYIYIWIAGANGATYASIYLFGEAELHAYAGAGLAAAALVLTILWDLRPARARAKGARRKPLETSRAIWDAYVESWGPNCWYCGAEKLRDRRELHLDHVEPDAKDGSNDDCWNRALACAPCNMAKGDRLSVEETIDNARHEGRIPTDPLKEEALSRFRRRMEWAQKRWDDEVVPAARG